MSRREQSELLGIQLQMWALEGNFNLFVHLFFLSFIPQMHWSVVSVPGTLLGSGAA